MLLGETRVHALEPQFFEGKPMTARFVKLIAVPFEYEAKLIATALADHGIASQIVGGTIGDFRAECFELIVVYVDQTKVAEAQKILSDRHRDAKSIDWELVDVGQPE